MDEFGGIPIITCVTAAQWDTWLADNHASSPGIWLKIAKKGASTPTITISEALDGALCYGWIDSIRRRFDDSHYLQRYSPRTSRSSWSAVNVARAEALIQSGRMREAGLAAIAAARADGRWERAYAPQSTATVPDDLTAALADNPAAQANFESLGRTARYGLILRLMKAASPAERADTVGKIIGELTDHS
ncbi:hypothetical protein NN3_18360 [Nocardia neocaledoniensis NBRC 108232]|uniref:Uncharacterized protein YdeI (YjbR/CyaY-like superfamily) n=2 Tax=Nocardia neocaledoniensis TaxID=236511 RepID=A0A317N608_9NOCA|nr:uncharacterized protein YdeI (YjbR/CyaY-like superfamily) [Nocardia neocaledoniensis]GEM30829.1 hypothetical protein NN3_18360 [Nocardia neocaledoniensis NBRC 108232]